MEIKRTANAGVLLKLDGFSILLDGICGVIPPYIATPQNIRQQLYSNLPDIVAYTHQHLDHYDNAYAEHFKAATGKPVLEPPCFGEFQYGNLKVSAIESRHIGNDRISHASFFIMGSLCVWFLGDASPSDIKLKENLPIPDVIIAPYSYVNNETALKITKQFGARYVVVLHLPEENNDVYRIRKAVKQTVVGESNIFLLNMGETLIIN